MSLSMRRTFRKFRFPVLLVAFAFVASSAFELRAQGSMDDEGFLHSFDRPVRVGLVSTGGDAFRDTFFRALVSSDDAGIVDPSGLYDSVRDADVFVYVVNGWSDALVLPGSEIFGEIFREVSELPEVAAGTSIRVILNDSRQFALFFLNSEMLIDYSFSCVANDILEALADEIEQFVTARDNCI